MVNAQEVQPNKIASPPLQQQSQPTRGVCQRCGGSHQKGACPAFGQICNKCGGRNHFGKVCKKSQMSNGSNTGILRAHLGMLRTTTTVKSTGKEAPEE